MVLRDYPMPELHLGDWVYFEAMGAYTVAAASNFNGMPVPQPYYLLQSRHAYLFERIAVDMPAALSPRMMPDDLGLECNLSDERAQPEPLFGAVTVTLNDLDINERPRTPEPSNQLQLEIPLGVTPIGLSALFETCSESSETSSDYQSIDFAFGTIYWRE